METAQRLAASAGPSFTGGRRWPRDSPAPPVRGTPARAGGATGTGLPEETGAQAGIQPSSAELAPAGPHPTFRLKMPPSNPGTKRARKHIARGLPVQLGSTFKALVRIRAPATHVLAVRKQAFALRVKRHQLPLVSSLPFYKVLLHPTGGSRSCSCIIILRKSSNHHPASTAPTRPLLHSLLLGTKRRRGLAARGRTTLDASQHGHASSGQAAGTSEASQLTLRN